MTETETDQLEVPQAALDALPRRYTASIDAELVRAIAAPVVAADYRRLLAEHEPWELLQAIHDRIAKLDGGGRG